MTILATLIVLGVLIFVHELGHFVAARSVGIRVERFSIGLGPRVWGYRRGDTEYVLSAIPLGGYVKMGGMDDEVMAKIEGGDTPPAPGADAAGTPSSAHPSTPEGTGTTAREEGTPEGASSSGPPSAPPPRRPRSHPSDFDSKPVWARAWVISAGVIMNMLFAFVAYTVVAAGWGNAEADTTRMGSVRAEALPAGVEALAEIPVGAHLVQVGEREVSHWGEVRNAFLELPAGPATVRFTDPSGSVEVRIPTAQADRERIARSMAFWTDPVLAFVEPGSPADRGGLRTGDRITALNDEAINVWSEFHSRIQSFPEQEVRISLLRDGGELTRTVTPGAAQGQTLDGEVTTIGRIGVAVQNPPLAYERVAPLEAVAVGWDETVYVTGFILGFLRDLVTGQVSPRNLGSIVTIGEASGQAAAEGIPVFLRFMALFSINLAILNLLPIPVLDGGHLVFLTIEAVRGKPVSIEQRMRWSQVGFVILIGIMALALGNDFLRLFGL